MNKMPVLFLTIFLPLLLSCSESTEPEGNALPPDDDFEVLDEADIGPDGGTLSGGGFEMTIPAGAFDATVTLELAVSREEPSGDGNSVTPYFRVDGLPEVSREDLQIAIEYDGALVEESFIVEGLYVDGELEDAELQMHYTPLETVESGGSLVATALSSGGTGGPPGPRKSDAMRMLRFFMGLTNRVKSSTDFFEFFHDEDYTPDVALLALLLEAELAVIMEDWDLQFGADEFLFPIKVFIRESSRDSPGDWRLSSFTSSGGHGRSRAAIFMSPGWIVPEMHIRFPELAGAALLGFHQAMCEGSWQAYKDPTQFVIHQAFREWAKGEFTIDPEFVSPPGLNGREREVLGGLIAGMGDPSDASARGHGQAISPYAKHLIDNGLYFGIERYKQAYEKVRTGMPVLDAIESSMLIPTLLYAEFLNHYFESRIYDVDDLILTQDTIDAWIPGTASPTFSLNDGDPTVFSDLSAKVIAIHLESFYEEDAVIRLQIESPGAEYGDFSIYLFARHGETLGCRGHGDDWLLDNLDLYPQDDVTELFAVAMNLTHDPDYMGEADVYVTLTLEQTANFTLSPTLGFDYKYIFDPDEPPAHSPYYSLLLPSVRGPLSSGPFEWQVDQADNIGDGVSIAYTGTYEGNINEDLTVVEEFVVDLSRRWLLDGVQVGLGTLYVLVEGPWSTETPGNFGASGMEVCEYLFDVDIQTWHDLAGEQHLTYWGCNSESWLGVSIW